MQNLYRDPSHLTQNKWKCIVAHFSHFYDTELLDVSYIAAYFNGSHELHPGPHSGSFRKNQVKSNASLTFYKIGMCC